MLSGLIGRGQALAEARAERVRGEIADSVAREVADVVVSVEDDMVVVAGRSLRWRAVAEPALRWIGRMR